MTETTTTGHDMTRTGTLTLAEFLLARIAGDEAAYRNAGQLLFAEDRCLAECEAKRRIIELHKAEDRSGGWGAPADWRCAECGGRSAHPNLGWVPFAQKWPCQTIRLLALPYADHSDYQPEWRVDG